MNELKINQAIAHIIGIQYIEESCGLWSALWPDGRVIGFKVGLSLEHLKNVATPYFCRDLNAMREAEMTLKCPAWQRDYDQHLGEVARAGNRFHVTTASSRQRAEAFLRTLGKWEEVRG